MISCLDVPPQIITVIREFHDGMKPSVQSSDDTCSKPFEVNQGLHQKCVLSPLLFNIFIATVLNVRRSARTRTFSPSSFIHRNSRGGKDSSLRQTTYAEPSGACYTLTCIVSRSPQALATMMEVIVHVCDAFDLTVSEKKTETMCMPAPHILPVVMHVEAAGQRYKQTQSFI